MAPEAGLEPATDRMSTRLNSSHQIKSYAVLCLRKHSFNLSFARHCRSACPMLLAPHQFPLSLLSFKFFLLSFLAVIRNLHSFPTRRSSDLKPAVRILQDIDPEPKTDNHAASKLKWLQRQGSNLQ